MNKSRLNAIKNGDKFYKGSECKKCGTTQRYAVSASCVQCTKDRSKKNYAEMVGVFRLVRGGVE